MPQTPGTMRTVLLGICIAMTSAAMAQRECAVTNYLSQQSAADPAITQRIQSIEQFIKQQAFAKMEGEEANVIRIPVVVHILYKTATENISDEQVRSQIDVLNRDFRRKNADTVNTPARFKAFAADVQVEFYLATADPDGRATNGIVRRQTGVSQWKLDDKIKYSASGGDDAWDSRSYLNIWVGNLGGTQGYSSMPGSLPGKDGIAIHYTAFGTINSSAPHHLGRTTVHEIGHWLGLRHIWGDTYCGDDLVDDTPKQGNFTTGCPTGFRSSCNNNATGDMYMNFMDYTTDACVNMFTYGQKERMLALFNLGGPRYSLLSSRGLDAPWNLTQPEVQPAPLPEAKVRIFPNPVVSEITITFNEDATWIGKNLAIVNAQGITVARVQVKSVNQKIDLGRLNPGMYFIQGENGDVKLREKLVRL